MTGRGSVRVVSFVLVTWLPHVFWDFENGAGGSFTQDCSARSDLLRSESSRLAFLHAALSHCWTLVCFESLRALDWIGTYSRKMVNLKFEIDC